MEGEGHNQVSPSQPAVSSLTLLWRWYKPYSTRTRATAQRHSIVTTVILSHQHQPHQNRHHHHHHQPTNTNTWYQQTPCPLEGTAST